MKTIDSLRENQKLVLSLGVAFNALIPELAMAWLTELSSNAIRKCFRRMVKAKLLLRYFYGDNRESYYLLSRRAIRLLGIPPRRVSPLGWPALIQAVGVLGICVAANLDKLSAADFAQAFPHLCPRRGFQVGYYALTAENQLVWIVVDHGATAFTMAKKIRKVISKRYDIPAFRDLIVARGLSIIVATPTPEKATDIEAELTKDPPRFVRVQVVPVAALIPLMLERDKK
ncbi:MAG TPA: hypothetical protein VE988_20610 [Gemmataceae bacterium]|nr:hypothetical protein [Gemmataceae bacterium]